jgi:hypothetical protein
MTLDPAKEAEVRRRLTLLYKNHQEMVDAYLAEYGTDISMKSIQAIREQFPGLADTGAQPIVAPSAVAPSAVAPSAVAPAPDLPLAAGAVPDTSKFPGLIHISQYPVAAKTAQTLDLDHDRCPVYTRICDCPVCSKWGLTGYELKAKSLTTVDDPFLAPVYQPATPLFDPLNYLTANIIVCDKCLLASPDHKDFVQYNKITRQNEPSRLSQPALRELQSEESMAERRALFEASGIGNDLFSVPRSIAAACLSYQLADMRAEAEQNAKVLGATFKRGSYWLRIALLQRQAGMDDKPSLRLALGHFKNSFMMSDFPKPELEYHTLFVLFSLHLYLGETKEGRDYITVMENTRSSMEKKEIPSTPSTFSALKKWIDRAKNRWEDRESPNLWKTPGIG